MSQNCCDCDHVHSDTRKLSPWKWRCMMAPIPLSAAQDIALEYVDPGYRAEPPYSLCVYLRRDRPECPSFSPRREAANATSA